MNRFLIPILLALFLIPSVASAQLSTRTMRAIEACFEDTGDTCDLGGGTSSSISGGGSSVTASASGVEVVGQLLLPDGSRSSPALSFTDDADTGLFRPSENAVSVAILGDEKITFSHSSGDGWIALMASGHILWSSTSVPTGPNDLKLSRGAANRLDLAQGDMLRMSGDGAPDAGLCDAAGENGTEYTDTTNGNKYICDQVGSSTGWAVLFDFSS